MLSLKLRRNSKNKISIFSRKCRGKSRYLCITSVNLRWSMSMSTSTHNECQVKISCGRKHFAILSFSFYKVQYVIQYSLMRKMLYGDSDRAAAEHRHISVFLSFFFQTFKYVLGEEIAGLNQASIPNNKQWNLLSWISQTRRYKTKDSENCDITWDCDCVCTDLKKSYYFI